MNTQLKEKLFDILLKEYDKPMCVTMAQKLIPNILSAISEALPKKKKWDIEENTEDEIMGYNQAISDIHQLLKG